MKQWEREKNGEGWERRKPSAAKQAWFLDRREDRERLYLAGIKPRLSEHPALFVLSSITDLDALQDRT